MKILRMPEPSGVAARSRINKAWEAREPAFVEKIGLQIIKDIDPYKAVAFDVATGNAPVIGSRTEHRAFLRRNNYTEIGNEKMERPKEPTFAPLRPDIIRAMHEVKNR